MKSLLIAILGWWLILACCLPAAGQTVELKAGRKVIGEVLKNDEQGLVVDLGFTALRIPRGEIIRVTGEGGATTQPVGLLAATEPATQAVEKKSPQWQLYRAAELEPTTIEACAHRFGEAVVMISSPGGQGSGFIITPDGYCITNYHVIAQETKIKVTVFRRTDTGYEQKHHRDVRIVALNPFVDLALLKIESPQEHFRYAYLGRMEELEGGQEVFAIGNPLGLTRTISSGIVSTTNRNFEGDLYIQTTTDINPGNSGGPLFNLRGEVIGVTSMGYLFLSGLNFAIPVDVVQRFIMNRDAFAYDEDNPNAGFRYHQPAARADRQPPPAGRLPLPETPE